jgi:uncharacterized membrane protein
LVLMGASGGYYAHRSYGYRGLGAVVVILVLVLAILWLMGAFRAWPI